MLSLRLQTTHIIMIYIYIYALIYVIHMSLNCMNILIIYPWVLQAVVQLTKKQQPAFKISFNLKVKMGFLK